MSEKSKILELTEVVSLAVFVSLIAAAALYWFT